MLRKLLKYELQATARMFLPLYALLVVFSLINHFFLKVNISYLNIPQGISLALYFAIMIGVFVITFIVTITRFYKNLLKDEGYLMFTLPVTVPQLINAKLIVAFLWNISSMIVAMLSVLLLIVDPQIFGSIGELFQDLGETLQTIGAPAYAIMIEVILLALLSSIDGILEIYFCLSVGQLFTRHRVIGAILAYLGLGVINQIIVSVGFVICYLDPIRNAFAALPELAQIQVVLLLCILYVIIELSVYYLVSYQMLKKKLNLE